MHRNKLFSVPLEEKNDSFVYQGSDWRPDTVIGGGNFISGCSVRAVRALAGMDPVYKLRLNIHAENYRQTRKVWEIT